MKVAFLASEVIPYAKTGGLADVAGALPKFLAGLGADVRVFMPLYREVRKKNLPLEKVLDAAFLDMGGEKLTYAVFAHRADGVTTFFIDRPDDFDRDHLYGTAAGDYPDNGERFAFFCRAALETMRATGFSPDIIHGHDWQSRPDLRLSPDDLRRRRLFRPDAHALHHPQPRLSGPFRQGRPRPRRAARCPCST